ncbi:Predicted dehydrogenase [Catalinimonas alkaloidigena]|uniref:Predicted dehydrogenase n=1 Tax=Catalinimonas alkaloidigena TaxID=1075417 RepID=A0A1G9RL22_9BACT|nr:Gfo/Idh/MocA family oxidoreductase [Catalinimonas alkaloidigena]SDM23956.1 Predicted dehydrogenase [Catalinimonas alkaloidigena]
MKQDNLPKRHLNRREFVKGAGLAAGAFMIVPRHVLGKGFVAPSDKLNIAGVGIGGMGKANLKNLESENIVALCDVDHAYAAPVFETYPNAKRYKDYRQMLDKQKDIDALVIATPDHTHAVVAMAGLQMGKHLYVQKPLTFTVYEARVLADAARKAKVVTQMGNQGHSTDDARKINEWIQAGAIGEVSEVHAWTNRPIWPQGMPRPEKSQPVPDTLAWDLFLGPAPFVPYNEAYTPFKWRGWTDYGVGAIGDMGAHLIDHPNWALELGPPSSVMATSTPFNKESYPLATIVHYEFPAKAGRPAVTMHWYDGGLMPPRPDELPEGEEMNKTGGVIFVGSKGKLMHETYGRNPRLLPQGLMDAFQPPKPTIPRVTVSHEMDWANACKEGKGRKPSSNFDYAGPLTETMLLGVVGLYEPNKKLIWDNTNMQFTNAPELNQYLRRDYRDGWSLGL